MASGVAVHSDCIDVFQELKLKKKFNYLVFNLNKDLTEIVVLDSGKLDKYDDFITTKLPEDECRWAIYDFEFEKEDGSRRNKITFISWSPDNAKTKQKMMFASSRVGLKNALTGVAVEIQGSDYSEVSYDIVLEKANRGA